MNQYRINLLLFVLFTFGMCQNIFGQRTKTRGKEKPELEVHISSNINVNLKVHNFSFFREYRYFGMDSLHVEFSNEFEFLRPKLNLGFSIQLKRGDKYQEISITQLSFANGKTNASRSYVDSEYIFYEGQNWSSFNLGFRYEYGKYFSKKRGKDKFKFGLGLGLEQSYSSYKIEQLLNNSPPVFARLYEFEISAIPSFQFKLTKRARMEFKAIPNILLFTVNQTRFDDVGLEPINRSLTRVPEFNGPELNMAFSLQFKFDISKDTRRRRKG